MFNVYTYRCLFTHVYLVILVIQCITSGILVEHTCHYIHVKLACATAWRFTVSPQCNIQLERELLIFFLRVCAGTTFGWWILITSKLQIHICSAAHTHTSTQPYMWHQKQVNRKTADWIRVERLTRLSESKGWIRRKGKKRWWDRKHWYRKWLWGNLINAGFSTLHYSCC